MTGDRPRGTVAATALQLIVFDLDGTLVDSHRDLAAAANGLVSGLGGTGLSDQQVVSMVGEGAAVLVRRALSASGLDSDTPGALERFLSIYDGCLLDDTAPYPGMVDVLTELFPRYTLAVLTNKPARATARILEGLGLDRFFGLVVGGDSRFGRKPAPEGLQHIIAASGATPATTVMVGDSPVDRETARRAGAAICLARFGFGYVFGPEDLDGTELLIDEPGDLLRLLR